MISAAESLQTLREATLVSSATIALALVLRRPVRLSFDARIAYALWWAVPAALVAVLMPAREAPIPAPVLVFMHSALPQAVASPIVTAPDCASLLLMLWWAGALVALVWFVRQQRSFQRGLGLITQRADGLYQAQSNAGLPAAMGWLRPRIVVPADFDQRYASDERALLQAHERAHIARGDLHWNALALVLRCLFWFNPLLHFAARHFRHDQELACDQRVITMNPQARRLYGEAMLKTQLAAQVLPLGCHWGFSHPLKERITMLGQPVPSAVRRMAGGLCVIALTLSCGYAAWAAQPAPAAAVPAGSLRVKTVLRIDDGEPQSSTFTVLPGTPLLSTYSQGGHTWTVSGSASKGDGSWRGMLVFAATIRRDDQIIGSPKIAMVSGKPGVIRIGEDKSAVGGKFEGVELDVTLTEAANAPSVASNGSEAIEANPADSVQRTDAPAYPAEALAKKQSGHVVLLVDIDTAGRVTAVNVERSEPAGVFDAAAVQAAWKWQFHPAQEDGKAVAGRVRVPVTFESNHAGGDAKPQV